MKAFGWFRGKYRGKTKGREIDISRITLTTSYPEGKTSLAVMHLSIPTEWNENADERERIIIDASPREMRALLAQLERQLRDYDAREEDG